MFRPPSQVSGFRFQVSRLLVACLCFAALATSSPAMLGETLAQITKHRGKPAGQPDKTKAVWVFEGGDEQVVYAVKFDAAGRSIAETLQPVRTGSPLHTVIAVDFIKAQRATLGDSKTVREPAFGEKFTFAGQELVVAKDEYVILDEPNGFLLVYVRGSLPSVTVLAPAALQ
jgi:hypothetical protein